MMHRSPALIACLYTLIAVFSEFPDAVAASAAGSDTNKIDACLAFTMPDPAALFASPKKVFAHYFYPFPLQVDDTAPSQDYYNRNFLSPNGESGKWAAKGGFLRQRPLPVGTVTAANYQLSNMEQEVRMAIARGITGFTVDVMGVKDATVADSNLHRLLSAAQAVDPRFKIVVMPDLTALKTDADAVTKIIASVASSPSAYRLDDGRLVVTAFNASQNPPEWWASIFAQLKSQGINIAFVPTFLGWQGQAKAFAAISDGFGDWGTATAGVSGRMKGDPAVAHSYGKLFMMPVDPQQFRPRDGIVVEASNSATFRNAWTSAIDGAADWVQLVTWSDFSESSEIEPSTDATLRRDIGTGFYDLNAYYSTWFLLGKQPAITHDVLYYFYRREPANAASPSQTAFKAGSGAALEDNIELLAFLTAPGSITIDIGGQSFTQNAPAGITSFKVPIQPGTPTFSIARNGSTVFSFQAPVQIFGQGGLPSGVSDLTYWSGSASKNGICSL